MIKEWIRIQSIWDKFLYWTWRKAVNLFSASFKKESESFPSCHYALKIIFRQMIPIIWTGPLSRK